MMEFWLSKSSSHELFLFSRWYSGFQEAFLTNFFHDGILAIKEPFSRAFLFSRWYSGYQEAFLMNFFHDGILAIKEPFSRTFFTMEFWLSRSLSHELFSRWNSGYQGAFLTVVWTSLGPLPRWVPGPTTRWVPGTTRLELHDT
jgi:hypothetical protein